jgi:hypothetical protein
MSKKIFEKCLFLKGMFLFCLKLFLKVFVLALPNRGRGRGGGLGEP